MDGQSGGPGDRRDPLRWTWDRLRWLGATDVGAVAMGARQVSPVNIFQPEDEARLYREYQKYADAGHLNDLARQMGRTKHFLCRRAGMLGLTDPTRKKPYLAEGMSKFIRKWIAKNGHPRGMAGKRHGEHAKQIVAKASRERWSSMSEQNRADFVQLQVKARHKSTAPRNNVTWKQGWGVVGGKRCFFRSRWEANYARYLEWLKQQKQIREWDHEPVTFWFLNIKRGTRSYLPDFRVIENDGREIFHEVKGWIDAGSKTKLKRMKKYHPQVKLILIDTKGYKAIKNKMSNAIKGWE